MPDERIDLPQGQRHGRLPLQVAAEETVRRDAELEGHLRRLVNAGRPVGPGEREDAEDTADPRGTVLLVDLRAHGADRRPRALRPRQQADGGGRGAGRVIRVGDLVPPARRTPVFAEELARRRLEQPHLEVVPLHREPLPDPARRRPVIGGVDLDTPVEMDRAQPEAVVAKRLQGQRAERRLLFSKHHGHLPLRRAVDARVGPACFPAVEMRLRVRELLEAQPLEWRLLRVPDRRLDLARAYVQSAQGNRVSSGLIWCSVVVDNRYGKG